MKKLLLLSLFSGVVQAAPANYTIDPSHTFPSFEADHMGISVWRGKINTNSGTVLLDKDAGYGIVDINIDLSSIVFGQDALNKLAQGSDFFDLAKFPKTSYRGKLTAFANGAPTELVGELTLHGVTKPLTLKIAKFKCIPHPMLKRELCGADAYAVFQRDQFGLGAGKDYGFNMDVNLRIQVEAVKND
ncbi:MAG: YceI family protein [Sphingomonadaceae bacterium]